MRAVLLFVVLAWAGAAETAPPGYSLATIAGTLSNGDGGPATAALIGNIQGVAVDPSGNLYISDTDHNQVRKIDAAGTITHFAGTGAAAFGGDGGPAANAPLNLPYGLAADRAGNLYVADLGNNRVRRIASDGTITTVAGTGQSGSGGDGGPAVRAQLNAPRNVALDAGGNLYIAEFGGQRIRKVSADGQISTVAGSGVAGFSGDEGAASTAHLSYPAGLAVDSRGTLYVADSQNGRVRMIQPDGLISTILGGKSGTALLTPTALAMDGGGTLYVGDQSEMVRAFTTAGAWTNFAGVGIAGFGGDGGPAAWADLSAPRDLAVDGSGRVYIADGARVRRVGVDGIIRTVAGDAQAAAPGDGGSATAAPLLQPSAVALDDAGNLYVAETGAHRIRKVTPAGRISTIAGTGLGGDSGDGGAAGNAQLNAPSDVAVDAFGNILIADQNNHRVRAITADGNISTIVGTGTSGMGADGLPGSQTPLDTPRGVCADHSGIIYVVDSGNHRVVRVAPGATAVTTIVGKGKAGDNGDGGAAIQALLNAPAGCAVDTEGNLFIADTLNNRIRRITLAGTISTAAGTGTAGFGGDNNPATAALLHAPAGVKITGDGNLLIADTGNNRIRLVTADGIIRTVSGGDSTPLQAPRGLAVDGSGDVYFAESGSNLVRELTPVGALPPPAITDAAVLAMVNAISLATGPVAPGEVVTIFGSGLGPGAGATGSVDSSGLLATSAGGTQVFFDGVAAPIFYAQSGQVNVQVPYTVGQSASTHVAVRVKGVVAGTLTVPVAAAAPALFPVALNVDGSPNSPACPAPANTTLTLFATGEGLDDGANVSGQAASPPLARPQLPLALTVGGMPAQVLTAASATGLVGMLAVTVRLPGEFLPSGPVPVVLTVGSTASPAIIVWLK